MRAFISTYSQVHRTSLLYLERIRVLYIHAFVEIWYKIVMYVPKAWVLYPRIRVLSSRIWAESQLRCIVCHAYVCSLGTYAWIYEQSKHKFLTHAFVNNTHWCTFHYETCISLAYLTPPCLKLTASRIFFIFGVFKKLLFRKPRRRLYTNLISWKVWLDRTRVERVH